jgi:hypothetical protein
MCNLNQLFHDSDTNSLQIFASSSQWLQNHIMSENSALCWKYHDGFNNKARTIVRIVLFLSLGFGAACSTNDELLLTQPVPAAFPKLSDVPPRPTGGMTRAQQNVLQQDLEDLSATHEETRTRQIIRR